MDDRLQDQDVGLIRSPLKNPEGRLVLLLKVADKLLQGPLVKRLEKTLQFSADEPLKRVLEKLKDMPLGKRGRIRWDLADLDLKEIAPTAEGPGIRVEVAGRCEVNLDLDNVTWRNPGQ